MYNLLVFREVLLVAFLLLLLFLEPQQVKAIYDPFSVPNNRFGIHILEPAEVEKATELVNSSGGQWGYVTIPIRANDRDLPKWTKFMEDSRRLKIIPILRIASFPVDDHWMAPNEYDLVDFANFLDELPWPTQNRYVIVYNEPNHDGEWGGFVYPGEYARILDRAVDIFHKKNSDFFVISAGMDASAPNGQSSMNEYEYFRRMNQAWPGIFERIDGFSAHAYGNPAFSSFPNIYSQVNIASYRFEQDYLCNNLSACNLKVFITEAGWENGGWYRQAFENIWTENNIVAITPFVLNAQAGPFEDFSFVDSNNNFKEFAIEIKNLQKVSGQPILPQTKKSETAKMNPLWTGNLPRTLKTDWLPSSVQEFLRILKFLK